ncbi:NosD domain-containing protein [Bartonella schoenbuchensis]|uniref:NosD domain-containing protein n=1 Tax=Bartonella schoenbuchensis TaxID=165694 RepID=UPI0031CCD97D
MVMRRVFNHHVCLCVLSTAILAGLALMTSQTKVYAQAQNCKGLGGGRGGSQTDSESGLIVCDGGEKGTGWSDGSGWGELSGTNRNIDMSKYSDYEAAVTITGANTKIKIKSKLTVRDKSGSSQKTAIKVYDGGKLALVGGVDVTEVKKGIVVDGRGSSVMVMTGSIGVRKGGGGSLIEVKNGGEVMLMKEVKVTGSGNVNGEVVINNGGTVELMGTGLSVSKGTGIKIMGTGTATVRGGGATIEVGGNGTGMEMDMSGGTANVMELNISGGGGNGMGVLINGSGTVVMTKVKLMQLETGARVTSGVLTLNGGSKIDVGGSGGTGMYVSNGRVEMMGTTVTLQGGGTGMEVIGGTVMMMSGEIRGNGGGGSKGVYVTGGSGNVTLTSVKLMQLETGARVTNGTLRLNGTTKIEVGGNGSGVSVSGSGQVMMNGTTTITVKGSGTGMYVTGGTVVMEGTTINVTAGGKGMYVTGGDVVMSGETKIDVGAGGKGMEVGGSGTVMMGGMTTIKGSGSGKGVYVKGGNLTVEGVDISQVETGINMEAGESLTVDGGSIVGNGSGKGVYVTGNADVTLENVNISEVEMGIWMEGKSLTVSGGKIGFKGTYGVYAGGGVTANLTGVTIMGKGKGDGIYVKGGTANVTLEGVNISNVERGIYAGGGTLKVEKGARIEFTGNYGVMVEGGTAELTGVTIEGRGGNGVGMSKGVYVGKGSLTLTRVGISKVQMGVEMRAGESLTVNGGTIGFTGKDGYGVYVGETVKSTTLAGVEITGSGSGTGMYVTGGEVTVSGVGISQVATGVEMKKGTLIMKEGTKINFTGKYGVMVGSSVTSASLTDVTIEGKGSGYGVLMTGGTVMMTKVNVSNVERGIAMSGNGTLIGVNISQAGMGIYAMGGKSLTVKDGTIRFTGAYGVMVEGGVTRASLTGVKITGSGKGDGIYAMGGVLMVSGGTIKEVERGIAMTGGGVLMVIGGEIKGVKEGIKMMGYGVLKVKDGTRIEFMGSDGYGVYVEGGVRADLTGTKIVGRGDGYGVYAEGGKVTVKGGTRITGVKAGIYATGYGVLKVKDGTRIEFEGKYGYGIYVGEGVRADLTGVTIEGRGSGVEDRTGVWVKGGEVMMKQVEISNVGTGVEMSDGAMWLKETHLRNVAKGMTIEEGVMRMEGGSVEFKGEHGISLTKGYAFLRGVNMTYTSNGPNANFIKVEGGKVLAEGITITGNGGKGQGVKVANGGAVWLKETNFSNVRSGMTISEGSVFMFKGGITFKGEYGIYLSKGQALLSDFNITGPGGTSKTTATGIGVVVSSLGEVMMRDVNISQVEMGARVTSGLLVMDKGSITFKGKHGINLIRGHAFLNGVNITGPGSGTGIELGYGQVLIKGTTFTNVDKAITVTQGDVKMEGGEITFTGEHGILLKQGGVALMGVTMTYKGNSTTADFIKITGEDTTNAVEAVDPKTRKTFTPKSAVVVAASLKIDGSGHGQALNVTNGGRVVLVNPTYTNVHTGMTITKGAVQMIEGSMEFKGGHGIYLKRGHALLTNVTMTYKGYEQNTTFLKVEAENVLNTADIIGTGIKIDGKGYGQGVYVTKGGRVKLKNALLSNVINGVSVANGEFWMKGGEIAFKGDYGVSLSTGNVVLKGVIMEYKGNNRGAKAANTASPSFIKVDGRGANLVAIKVMFTGNEQGLGVKVSNGGHVTLKHMFFLHCV